MKLFFPGYSGRNFLLLSFVSLFTLLIPVQVFCQNNEFYSKTYTTEHGLPNNHVINIIQDKTGILWIATFDGLSKFDGYEFKNYFGNPKDTNSIGVAQLAELALDLTDNLWILARGKFLYKFNRKNEKFLNFSPKLNSIAPILDQQSLAKDQSGNFWILSNEGMLRFNPVSYQTQLIPFQDESLISEMRWGSMSFDNKGDLWGVNSDMVFHFKLIYEANKQPVLRLSAKYRCDAGQHKMILQTNFPNFHFYHNIIHSGQNNLWMTTNYGLFFLDRALGRFIKYQDKLYSHDFIDNQIVKWSDFESGLHIYYPGSKREFRLNGLTDCVTESSFVDNQGNIWSSAFSVVSGEGSGLQKTVPTSPVFRNIILKNKLNGSKNCAVFSVSKDKNGSIWVGTRDYNYMLVVSPDGSVRRGFQITMEDHLSGVSPRSILFDNHENIWVGYLNNLLVRYNLNTKRVNYYNRTSPMFNTTLGFMKSFRNLQISSDGSIWAGGRYGFGNFNPSIDRVGFFEYLPNQAGTYICIDEKNSEYWVGMQGSVRFYKNQKFIRDIEINENRSDVVSLLNYDDSTLWITLYGGGICRLNKNDFRYEQFTTSDGLPNNSAYGIFKDSGKNLWISTNKGISRFNPVTRQFWNFGVSDGLFIEEFNGNAAFQGKDGEIIFGGMGGLVCFYPDSVDLHADTVKHDLVFSDFRVSGFQQVFDSAVSEKSSFVLQKGQDNFSFSFACIDLKNAEKINYRYRLSGNNNEWVYTDSRHRYLSYANLKPGSYNCVVEASDLRGEWRHRKTITVTIPPYFYQNSVVRLIALLLFATIVLLLVVLIFQKVKRKVEKREVALRNEVNYRSQMNPHFISNIMTAISGFMSRKDEVGAGKFLTTARDLIRKFLNNTEYDYILLRDELVILELFVELENQCREQKVEFNLSIDEAIDPDVVKVVPSLIQPLLENSIIHGFKSCKEKKPILKIRFKYENEYMVTCYVEDNGEGRFSSGSVIESKTYKHKSVAIENIRTRLHIHSFLRKKVYDLNYLPGETGGTIAVIRIPALF